MWPTGNAGAVGESAVVAGAEQAFPDGLALDAPQRLADYCNECADEPCQPPVAIIEGLTAYYPCLAGHAWVSRYADLDHLWAEPA